MDPWTILLLVVIGVIAASRMMQHSGALVLRPYVFWPVQSILVAAAVFVLVAKFSPNAQLDWTIKIFLALFLAWRLLQNWMFRENVRRNKSVDEFNAAEKRRQREAALAGEARRDGEDPGG